MLPDEVEAQLYEEIRETEMGSGAGTVAPPIAVAPIEYEEVILPGQRSDSYKITLCEAYGMAKN